MGNLSAKKKKKKKKGWGIQAQTETKFWFHYFEVQLFGQHGFNFVIIDTFLVFSLETSMGLTPLPF